MSVLKGFLRGISASVTLSNPPLYRYPYRNALEGFRADWKRIGGDIEAAIQIFDGNKDKSEDE